MPTKLREALVFHPQFIEGSYDRASRSVDVTIITEGVGNKRDKHYYSAPILQRAIAESVFEGAQAYADHPSKFGEANLPERSIRDLVGYYSKCRLAQVKDKNGKLVEGIAAKFTIQKGCDWVEGLIETAIDYKKQHPGKDYTGISINADGDAEPLDLHGTQVKAVTHIESVTSADIVTRPARGGGFIRFAESASGASQRRIAMLKTVIDAASRLAKLAEGEAVDPKELTSLSESLIEAAGKCQCGHAMHEGKCGANDCECAEGKVKEAEPDKTQEGKSKEVKAKTDTGDGNAGDETVESGKVQESDVSIDDLKKKYPSLWQAALTEAQSHVSDDVSELKKDNARMKASLAFHESHALATTKLKESTLPPAATKKLMISLIGHTAEEMDSMIEAEREYLEGIGVVRNGKLVEGAGARDHALPLRESDVDTNTSALLAGLEA